MAQIMLTVNGRSYPVACDDGQEERIRQLGQYIDGKVTEFARNGARSAMRASSSWPASSSPTSSPT